LAGLDRPMPKTHDLNATAGSSNGLIEGVAAPHDRMTTRDLRNPAAIWAKGILFLLLGIGASVLLLADVGSLKVAALLAIAVWGFCRAYYFAFYVIEKYVDPGYRFSGLVSFARYCLHHRSARERHRAEFNPVPWTRTT
jgi:hypothetical protein